MSFCDFIQGTEFDTPLLESFRNGDSVPDSTRFGFFKVIRKINLKLFNSNQSTYCFAAYKMIAFESKRVPILLSYSRGECNCPSYFYIKLTQLVHESIIVIIGGEAKKRNLYDRYFTDVSLSQSLRTICSGFIHFIFF